MEPVSLRDLPVLVVNDNATNRRILEEVLTSWRMKPEVAEGGRAALAALERAKAAQNPYRLVVIDAHRQSKFLKATPPTPKPEAGGAAGGPPSRSWPKWQRRLAR